MRRKYLGRKGEAEKAVSVALARPNGLSSRGNNHVPLSGAAYGGRIWFLIHEHRLHRVSPLCADMYGWLAWETALRCNLAAVLSSRVQCPISKWCALLVRVTRMPTSWHLVVKTTVVPVRIALAAILALS